MNESTHDRVSISSWAILAAMGFGAFAVGVWGFAHGLGLLVGPVFAGYMLAFLNWRWVFWIAVPLTVAVILVTLAATRHYRGVPVSGRYDVPGLLLGGLGITLLTYGWPAERR